MNIRNSLHSGDRLENHQIFRVGTIAIHRIIKEGFGSEAQTIVGLALVDFNNSGEGVAVYFENLAVLVDVLAGEVRRMEARGRGL